MRETEQTEHEAKRRQSCRSAKACEAASVAPRSKVAMAVAAHPDDIEFTMSGTLMLLGQAGYKLHYMNIADGYCGSATLHGDEIAAIRLREAKEAADMIGATFHPPLVGDIEIFHETPLLRRLCAIVRKVNPEILLLPSPQDYMEDHQNASRAMVTAAFCRNIPNYVSEPPMPYIDSEMAVYHAMPMGLTDQLRNPIRPEVFVDVSSVMETKRKMLSCHASQKDWLDASQGHGNYVRLMEDMARQVGELSGRFAYAEGWRQHLHLGFGPKGFDPLGDALSGYVTKW